MPRMLRTALALALLLAAPLAGAQSLSPGNFPGLQRPGLGLAPLHPMLGHPSPGLGVNRFPGLGHPSLRHPSPPPIVAPHRSVRHPHGAFKHARSRPGAGRHHARPHRFHAHHFRPGASLALPGLRLMIGKAPRLTIGKAPRHPRAYRRSRLPQPVFRRQDFACQGTTCTLGLNAADLADRGALVCIVTNRAGRCARVLRVTRP